MSRNVLGTRLLEPELERFLNISLEVSLLSISKLVCVVKHTLVAVHALSIGAVIVFIRALNLHTATIALGFNFPDGHEILKNQLDSAGIEHHFLELPGKLRVCTKIFDRSLKHMSK